MNAVSSKLYHTVAYSRGEVAVLVGLIGTGAHHLTCSSGDSFQKIPQLLGVERVQRSESNPRSGECRPGDKSPSIQRLPDLRTLLPWYHGEWSPGTWTLLYRESGSSGPVQRLSGLVQHFWIYPETLWVDSESESESRACARE